MARSSLVLIDVGQALIERLSFPSGEALSVGTLNGKTQASVDETEIVGDVARSTLGAAERL
jgi:hypothetical protein